MMQDIYTAYLKYDRDYEEKRTRLLTFIRRHSRAIERHRKALDKIEYSHEGWVTKVLTPQADEISEKLGGLPYEFYGPFGLTCETSVYFFPGEGREITKDETFSINVTPEYHGGKRDGFYLAYDTGRRTGQYAEGSIGWLNRMDAIRKEIPNDIDEIVALLRHSHAKEEEKC